MASPAGLEASHLQLGADVKQVVRREGAILQQQVSSDLQDRTSQNQKLLL